MAAGNRKDKRRSREEKESEAAAAAPVAKKRPLWVTVFLVTIGFSILVAGTAFSGAYLGAQSVERDKNYGPEEKTEDEAMDLGLAPLTLVRGLDIAQEKPLPRGAMGDRFMRLDVGLAPDGRATDSAAFLVLDPDQQKELEYPMVPRAPGAMSMDRVMSEICAPLERFGRLGGSELLHELMTAARQVAGGETEITSPATPETRPTNETPVSGFLISTIPPPSVYNSAVAAGDRRPPESIAAEQALPVIQPPSATAPIEADDAAAMRSRGLAP